MVSKSTRLQLYRSFFQRYCTSLQIYCLPIFAVEHVNLVDIITKPEHVFAFWKLKPSEAFVVFNIETSHSIFWANQVSGFCIICNSGLKHVQLQNFLGG